MKDALLMIAARVPVAGGTKTRLGQRIGMAEAALLYEAFLQDLAARLVPAARHAGIALAWTYSPPDADFPTVLADLGIDTREALFVPQDGPDWATRQDNLMRFAAEAGYRRAILIASDSPQLGWDAIADAFAALQTTDVVVGRVADGGYYLIGMSRYCDVLRDVPMSTGSAADDLIATARNRGYHVAEVADTFDIDIHHDLGQLMTALAPNGGDCPTTWRALGELGFR